MRFKLQFKGKQYNIEISETEQGETKIKVNSKEFVFEGEPAPAVSGTMAGKEISAVKSFPKKDFSEKAITAPISGVISEIFVKQGDKVKNTQKLILLSAMKMENEIVSDYDGKVKEILVEKNQKVKSGDNLLIIK